MVLPPIFKAATPVVAVLPYETLCLSKKLKIKLRTKLLPVPAGPERKILEDEFQTLYFPFREVSFPSFHMEMEWTATQFVQYLSTWTAVQKCIKETQLNPLTAAAEQLLKIWPAAEKHIVRWPLFIKAGAMS